MTFRISIAMATYNGAAHIQEQLDSFVAQERLPDELVICDDASTDQTKSIVDAFARRAPFEVRISQHDTNVGLNRNFEGALASCGGDLIFLSDQDDYWFPSKLRMVERVFVERDDVQVVANDQIIADENLIPTKFTKLGQLRALGRSDQSLITGCCTAMRREWRDVCLPLPADVNAYDNWIGAITTACDVRHVITEPLQLYRRHANNASHAVASRAEKLSSFDLLAKGADDQPARRMLKELGRTEQYLRHLQNALADARDIPTTVISEGIERLSRRRDAIQRRASIIARPMPGRAAEAIGFLLGGGYKQFSGVRSLVADLLR